MSTDEKDLRVDVDRCSGHARCLIVAPDVFDYDDTDNQAYVVPDVDTADKSDQVSAAIEACPEAAIGWAGSS